MMYKVPMPTKHNGVKLYTLKNQQIGIEYPAGEPNVTMAFDSALGRPTKTVTFRRKVYGRDDLPVGTGISRSEGQMNPRGSTTINDQDPDEDEGDEIVTKLMSYLNDKLTPEQLSSVAAILGSGDGPDGETNGEPQYRQASDRGLAGREARRRAEDADFERLFPDALKILQR
jgi:hypothetical protein